MPGRSQRRDWYRIANAADGTPARVDIYDEIGAGDPWSGGGVSASDFVADLAKVKGDLEIHINSPGGSVFDGLAIYNAIAQRPGNVTTVVDGLAASAASFIAQAGRTRIVAPGAMVMIHDAQGLCIGNEADMTETAGLLAKASANIAGIYAAHSGRPAFAFRQAMQAETWYTAQEAVDAGLADRIAERPAPAETTLTAAAWAREMRAAARQLLDLTPDAGEPDGWRGPDGKPLRVSQDVTAAREQWAAAASDTDDHAAMPAWLTALTAKEAASQ